MTPVFKQLPSWLPTFIEANVRNDGGRYGQQGPDSPEGMFLWGTLGYDSYLRPDGTVWVLIDRDWTGPKPDLEWRQADLQEAVGCLKVASVRLPRLQSLLPTKPPSEPPCPSCKGSGALTRPEVAFDGILCDTCHGIGWLLTDAI